jgi:Flp pilus assembly protein TadG
MIAFVNRATDSSGSRRLVASRLAVPALALAAMGCQQSSTGGGDGRTVVDAGSAADGSTADDTPPVFGGATSAAAATSTSVRVAWDPATDDQTPQSSLEYLVYFSESSGGQDFSAPQLTTEPGATRVTITDLSEDTAYFFVVRARDLAGNIDHNTREVSADTSDPDTEPPSFDGVESAIAVSATELELSWSPASDDTTPAEDIVYNVYVATASGAQDFSSPALTTPGGATRAVLGGLSSGATYFVVVRAEDLSGNEDDNEVEVSETTAEVSFAVDVQPIFTRSCTNQACHGSSRPKEGLDLTSGAAYDNLVNVASEQCGDLMRVAPGAVGASYLMRKLTGDRSGCFSGQQMPSPTNPLPAAELDIVGAWIEAGASDD